MKERKDLTGYPEIEIRILDEGPDIIDVCKIDGVEVPRLRKIEISAPFDDIPIVKFEILGRINLKMKSKVHVIEAIPFDDQGKEVEVPHQEKPKPEPVFTGVLGEKLRNEPRRKIKRGHSQKEFKKRLDSGLIENSPPSREKRPSESPSKGHTQPHPTPSIRRNRAES